MSDRDYERFLNEGVQVGKTREWLNCYTNEILREAIFLTCTCSALFSSEWLPRHSNTCPAYNTWKRATEDS